jgi:signal transduction histidine kinase
MNFFITPKVLIIDDQSSNRMMIKLTLKQNSYYEFLEVKNVAAGVNLAIKESPHIILIDASMLKMDRFEAIKILRNNPITKDIPILMLSALDKDEKDQALKSGISDFVPNLFERTELITRVNSLLHLYLMFLKNKKELKASNKNLEDTVNQAVKQKLEDMKLAAIGKMTAGITHEINTPLTYMKSNIELMGYDIDDIQGNEIIKKSLIESRDIVLNGTNRIKNIIDNTRELSKKGKNSFHNENLYSTIIFSTKMIYNRAKHIMPIYINNKIFDLDFDENFEIFNQSIIKEKLEQVWIIILNNACDEFENSKKEFSQRKMNITISQVKDKIKIKFKDNASNGIALDIISSIFDPFVSTKIDKGMGVGLYIAKDIVEEHFGTITAYNEDYCAVFEIVL